MLRHAENPSPTTATALEESPAEEPPRLADHAVADVDDPRAEGAGHDEFEIHLPRKVRITTADQHRLDHAQPLDLLRQATGHQASAALHG